ncbi:MAG: hypothetical protein GYA33_15235 [Thermogutta sp.]|nr:hypothetical protein [Thermogutta sp.]
MSESPESPIERIHAGRVRVGIVCTGGGVQALARLLSESGGSRTVLEAVVPYCRRAVIRYLGAPPDQFCAEPTARSLAMAAFFRALELHREELGADSSAQNGVPVAGVSCTASLATDRPKRGPHRIHVAAQSAAATVSWSLELEKGRRSRAEEEDVAARMILNAVAEVKGTSVEFPLPLLPGEAVFTHRAEAPPAWQELLLGETDAVRLGVPADWTGSAPPAIFPGAFNPLHAGHQRMAEMAEKILGVPVEFEISILNVDKPPLDYAELRRRAAQFSLEESVWLTRAPTFEEKSRRFPGAVFVVGADTIRRIADPRYYGHDGAAREAAIARIADRGCRFLVFARSVEGRCLELENLDLPPALRAVCRGVPREQFREDLSSSDLRTGRHDTPEFLD